MGLHQPPLMLQKLKALLLGLGAPTVTVEGGAGDASGMGAAGVTVGAPRSLADWGATLGCRQTERLHFAGILLANRTKRGSWMTWPVERPSSDLQALSSSLRHTHVSAAAEYSSGCRPRTDVLAAAGTGHALLCSRHAHCSHAECFRLQPVAAGELVKADPHVICHIGQASCPSVLALALRLVGCR